MMSGNMRRMIPGLTLLLLLGFFTAGEAMAQYNKNRGFRFQNRLEDDHQPYHFGFTLGVNTMNFDIRQSDQMGELKHVLSEFGYGFHIGIVSNLKLTRRLDLRFIPTISFGDRYIEYYYQEYNPYRDPNKVQLIEVTALEFPFHLKYKTERMTNTRAYLIGGLKYTHDLNNPVGSVVDDDIYLRMVGNDVHYEFGAGFDHYFYYFKFSVEIKASFGLNDLKRPGDEGVQYYNAIDRIHNRSIMISLLFE